ncbi:MAG UNVERIFIED_CONTAM: hypothetical protein LVT10_07010 [Anaerolineae bacterium]|jgi:hypothetical protein
MSAPASWAIKINTKKEKKIKRKKEIEREGERKKERKKKGKKEKGAQSSMIEKCDVVHARNQLEGKTKKKVSQTIAIL